MRISKHIPRDDIPGPYRSSSAGEGTGRERGEKKRRRDGRHREGKGKENLDRPPTRFGLKVVVIHRVNNHSRVFCCLASTSIFT